MKKISIIVPVYNTAAYLSKCVDSIIGQSYANKEIILVDDGSTDESGKICDGYAEKYPQMIRVFHQKNTGSSGARNKGIEMSTGELLSFIDSDDSIHPQMLSFCNSLIEKYHADMAAIEMYVEKPDNSRYCRVNAELELCWDTSEALIELNSYRYLHKSFCTCLFQKTVFDGLRFPLGKKSEDYWLLYQVVSRCRKIAYASKPMYYYYQRANSNSRSTTISLVPLEIAQNQLTFFQKYHPDIVFAAETDYVYESMGIYSAYARTGQVCSKELQRRLQTNVRRFLSSALKNSYIPPIKKFQALVFCCSLPLYRFIISKFEHR